MNRRICAIGRISLASIFLLPTLVFAQTKRSKSDANVSAIGHRSIGAGIDFYSPQKEGVLGKQLSLSVEKTAEFVSDPVTQGFVEHVADHVERNSDRHMPITIHLIDSDAVDAFTLPGGYQYITVGLLLRLESEGELASVLARGIARTALRSDTRIATELDIAQIASIPVSQGPWGLPQNNQPPLNDRLVELAAKRQAELDADYFGMQYLYKSGYDTKCFIQLVELIGDHGNSAPGSFTAYPSLSERLQLLQKEIAEILPQHDGAVVSTKEFRGFQDHLRAMHHGGDVPQKPGNEN